MLMSNPLPEAIAPGAHHVMIPMPAVLRQLDELCFGAPTMTTLAAPFAPEVTDTGGLLVWEHAAPDCRNEGEFRKRRIRSAQLETAIGQLFARRSGPDAGANSFRVTHTEHNFLCVEVEDLSNASFADQSPVPN